MNSEELKTFLHVDNRFYQKTAKNINLSTFYSTPYIWKLHAEL